MNKAFILLIILISSCSNIPLSYYKSSYEALRESLLKLDSVELNETYMKEKKFPILKLRFGSSRSIILVLVDETDEIKRWISADKIFIYTYKGKVIETKGMQNDFKINDYSFPNQITDGSKYIDTYIIDFFEPKLLNQYAISTFEIMESKKIDHPVKGRDPIIASRIKETVEIDGINLRYKNVFYFNSEGKLLRTEQKIHPFLNKVSIDFVDAYE
jgi:hypothetical protein